jgi:organic radical activating enzyme
MKKQGHEIAENLEIYDKRKEIRRRSIEQVINIIKEYPAKNVVITGGEPLLQKQELCDLVNHLIRDEYSIEIETNGTISPKGLDSHIQFNVSPKLLNSGNLNSRRIKPEVLEQFLGKKSFFKFVLGNPEDLEEVNQIINEIDIPKDRVYLMPEADNPELLEKNSKWLIEICKIKQYNFSSRLHIQLYGSKRGV